MRKSLLVLILTSFYSVLLAQIPSENEVQRAIRSLESEAGLANGTLSFMAVNMDNGQVIADYMGGRSMCPASIQKLFTTGVALEKLGADFQFETIIAGAGDKKTGQISGDLYVFPSGDPTLQSKYYSSEPNSLTRIKEGLSSFKDFNGSLIIDASKFSAHNTPRGWIWEDMGNYFGASPSALIWKDNLLEVYLNSGQIGSRAIISSKTKNTENLDIQIEVTASESNRDDTWFFSAPGSDMIYAKGTIPAHQTNFLVKASHPKPMIRFGNDLISSTGLNISNVRVDYDYIPHDGLNTLVKLTSPPLYSIVRMTNENSINLYAEALLVQLDDSERGKSVEGGVTGLSNYLTKKQVNLKGTRFIDGSGLSPTNRITAYSMIDLLTMMYRSKNKDSFMNSLAKAGKTGTLKSSFNSPTLTENMIGKSGTMAGVRNYAGYIKNSNGEWIAYCIMLNDYDEKKRSAIMTKLEELMIAMAEH